MYTLQWFKSQKVKKPERVLPPMSPEKSGSKATQRTSLLSSKGLDKLRFSVVGQSKEAAVSKSSSTFTFWCSYP
jgi:poly [ADP-ribose] polymerase 1